jgi:hypothetical protein
MKALAYLSTLPFDTLQLSPFLDRLCQVNLAEGHFHLPDLVMLRESVEVEDGEYQGLVHCIGIWYTL